MQRGAHAFLRARPRSATGEAAPMAKRGVRRRSRRLQGCAPAGGGGSSRRIRLLPNPAGEQDKEMHRVGVAFVQLTRSTFAEATAGRECLRPSALRARCTRKSTGEFRGRQVLRTQRDRKLRQYSASGSFCDGFALEGANSRKNAPRSVLPRPTYRPTAAEATACRRAINLGRSVLGAPGTLGPPGVAVKHRGTPKSALCGLFFTTCTHLRSTLCALQRTGPRFRRAGCAFVHFPD